jgi:hypothetical protein
MNIKLPNQEKTVDTAIKLRLDKIVAENTASKYSLRPTRSISKINSLKPLNVRPRPIRVIKK